MKKRITILITLLLLLMCIGTVNAEDNSFDNFNLTSDNLTNLDINDTLSENVNHSHSQVSEILNPPVKAATITAPGGTFSQLQSIFNGASSGDTIEITGDYTYDSGFTIDGVVVGADVTINGNGHTLNGLNSGRIFNLSGNNIVINNLNFINGWWGTDAHYNGGGAIFINNSNANIDIINCTFKDNFVRGKGGAICVKVVNALRIIGSTFVNNAASYSTWTEGGAIDMYNNGKDAGHYLEIANCSFVNNTLVAPISEAQNGAVLHLERIDYVYITGSSFVDNRGKASDYAYAPLSIWFIYNKLTINNNAFVNNYADNGEALYLSSIASLDINNNWWGNNTPSFSSLIKGSSSPQTYIIMNFTYDPDISNSHDSTFLYSYLNTVYNSSSNSYQPLVGVSPTRTVSYTVSDGTLAQPVGTIIGNHSTNFTYGNCVDNLTITAKIDNQAITLSTGSFTAFQFLIDKTPNNGVLNVTWNVTYNSLTDEWLKGGMRLNKSITINGNGFTFNGLNQARIFDVSENCFIDNATFINGVTPTSIHGGYHGGAISSGAYNVTVSNSVFKNNYANSWGGAIHQDSIVRPKVNEFYILNCTFINNTEGTGGAVNLNAVGYITGCLFENNTGGSYNGVVFVAFGPVCYNIFINNVGDYVAYDAYDSRNIAEFNWYGNNTPDISKISRYDAETWVVLNFTNITPFVTGSPVNLVASLNYAYNKSSGFYVPLADVIPLRNVTYNLSTGVISNLKSEFNSEDFESYSCSAGTTNLTISATVDNETIILRGPNVPGTFTQLQALIDATPAGGTLVLDRNYSFNPPLDIRHANGNGMFINKSITIEGNGYTLDALNLTRIFQISAESVLLSNISFVNGNAISTISSYYHGSAIYSSIPFTVINCTFRNNYARHYGAIESPNGVNVFNCSFFDNYAETNYAAIDVGGYSNITGCLFMGNKMGGSWASAIYLRNGIVEFNAFLDNYGRAIYTDGASIEKNWWGTNTPSFGGLIYGYTSKTWVIMNFTNLQDFNNLGGTVELLTSLDTLYNDSSGEYSKFSDYLPIRPVIYDATSGSFSQSIGNVSLNHTTNFTYPSGLSSLFINATIDNQVLNISTSDLSVNITVSNPNPSLVGIFNYIIQVENHGPYDAKDVSVNIKIPSVLIYLGDNSSGEYNTSTGIWSIGKIANSAIKILNITVRVPFNYSLVDTTHEAYVNVTGTYIDFNMLDNNDTVNITIRNITGGSYTLLQYLIDITPENDTLNLTFNVTYDPLYDASLIGGMHLNKTIRLEGNGFTINGNSTARIFEISANNVTLSNLIFINGVSVTSVHGGYYGGAISSGGDDVYVINSTFINNTSPGGWGGAIHQDTIRKPRTNKFYIYDCNFINNSQGVGGVVNINGISFIAGCLFENNTDGSTNGFLWTEAGEVYNNAFVNNIGKIIIIDNSLHSNFIEYNWYGNNTPDLSMVSGYSPETWVIMEFNNLTPITYSNGNSTLEVTLNKVYNKTSNTTSILIGDLPVRTVKYEWTNGNINPNTTSIILTNTTDFTYSANMGMWTVNATIDGQTLWLGSSDIGIIIIPNYNPIDDGKNISYTVMVINNGPMNASNINVTIHLPSFGLNITNITNNTGYWNETTGEWYIGDLNASQNVTLIINGTVTDPGPFLIWNATIINVTDYYDNNFTNNTFISNVTVIQWSDLNITKTVNDLHPKTRDNVTYTIIVYNHGPSTAINVTVFDNLSSHLVFINYTATNGTYNETTGIWFIDNITPGSNETLNITVLINESGITENLANVSCEHNDTNWTNNYANVTFETAPLSDLWVTIDMDPQTSNFITFHIQAGNNGIEPANGTIVELNISNLMVYVNHTNDGGVYNCATAVWDIGYIAVNETLNLTLIVQLDFPPSLNVTNITTSVNITSWSTDLYPENNTDNITFEAEIFGNFRLLQYLIDLQPANTVFVLPRSFAYDSINDAFQDTDTYDLINGVSIYKNLTIVNPDGYMIGGFGMARCLNITAPNTILDGLKIADGYSPLGAGLNIPANNVQVLRSNFTNNVLWGDYGGAIYVSGNNVLIQDNYFSRNNASKLGGAIGSMGASNLRILNNTFINNTAKSDDMSGGAIGLINTQATVNTNVFLDNNATSSVHIGSAIFTNNSNVNLEANWFGNNTPDMTTDELIYGNKPETWIMLDWEFVNPNMTGVELNVVFVLYNSTSGEKTPINYGLPYRNLKVTSRDPTLSWYNTTYTGNNSVNYTYNTAIPTYQINATVDYETITLEFNTLLNVYKTLVNDTIWFGDDLIYNITIVNYGPHDTSILNLTDFLPSDLTINSITPSIGNISNDTDNIYWLLSVPAGVNATLIINATPNVEGNYTNNITINTTTPLDYFINGTNKSVFGQVLSLSDLEVNLTIKTPPYYVGGEIVYNLRVANYGPSTAENIIVNMPVSSGLTYIYQDWPGTYSQSTGLWNIASLNSGDILDINITFRINSPGWYNQTVNITSDSVDDNTSNNNKTVSFNVTSQVDLVLNMAINKNETLYGDNNVYITLNVVNFGPGPADNVTVFTYFAGLGYLSAYGYGYFINDTPTAGRWLLGTLGVNITRTITLRFVASNVGNFTISGRANNTYNDSNWTNNYANVSISVLKYADLRITKAVSSSAVHVGDNITYTITVTNLAGFTVENVTVTDILDSRLYYDNNNPDYNGTDWFVGTVNVGETKTLTFNVTVIGNGTIRNNATVNGSLNDSNPNNNHVSISIFSGSLVSDLKITKTVNNTTPFLDENITYTITVTNLAGYNAENVTVYDPLPGVLVYDGNNPNFNGTEWFVGNLSVGETKNITFTVTVNGIGRIWNNVTVNSSLLDPNPGDNHDEVYIDVPFDGDLRISLSVIPNPPQANNPFIINVTVENFDTESNSNVMVDFLLPPSLTYINSTCMGSYNPITGKWNIGYLPASSKVNLEIWVSPGVIGNVTIEGNVSGTVTDINPGNNRANLTFEIVPAFDLTITKNASNYTIYDGDTISFDIVVWNNGPFVANNVKITDYLPYGLVYLFDNSSGVYHSNNHTVDWTLPYLNMGDNITIHLIAKVQGPGLSFNNKVYVSAYGTDLNISDNTAYSGVVNVTQVNDLEVILTVSKIVDIDLDEIITFYVTVVNHGPSNASGVIADFLLPTGLTYVSDNSTGFYIPSNGTWYIGHLANGTNITLEVKVNLTSGGKYTLNATVNGLYYDNDTSNNIVFLNISSLNLFDLNITAFWNLTNNTMFWNDLAEYTVIVHNNGTDNATNVTVELVVPGVTYVNHTGPGTLNNVTLVWDVGNLTVGEYKNITIIFNATSLGFFNTTGNITAYGHDTNTSNNNYTLNLTVLPVVDLVMTNITVNTTVTCVDGLLEFNVTVFNKGPCNATNTTILGLLPSGWLIVGGMTMGNFPVNSSEVFTIIVNASTVGNYSVGFNATINGRDLNITDNWLYFENITVVYACDLMITIKSSTSSVAAGDIVVYTITVSNLDWRTAHNVSANITIPSGLSLHHYYLASGEYNSSNGTWTIGNMSYRNSTTLFLFCTVDTMGDIEFWVNVSGDDYDFHLWNNNDTVNITGTMGLDLNISVFVDNSTPYTGDNITFTVLVENIGLVDASGVWVDIGIPVGFINPWSTDLNFTGSSYYIGNLSTGNIKTFNFTVTPILLGNGTFNFSVGANRVDYNLSNNFANITISPVGATDLQINITSNNSNIMVGDLVTYTITIYNNGTVDADNMMVYNTLPYSTVYSTSTPTYNPGTRLWIITNLSAGSSETLNITINHTTMGVYNYTVNITSDIIDINPSNNLDNITVIVSDYGDLITCFTVNSTSTLDGNFLNFTISVFNNGTFNYTNVKVYTNLPSTNTYTNSSIFDTNLGIWDVGNLIGFENKTISLLVNLTQIGNFIFWANSTSKEYDRNLSNNNQSLNITVFSDYDLKVTIFVNNNTPYFGDSVIFTINVTNYGPSTAHNITILNNIYGTLLNLTKGTYAGNVWTIEDLGSNETQTLNIQYAPLGSGISTYTVNVTSNYPFFDRNNTNNYDNITLNVSNAVDLIISITTNTTVANKTDLILYTVTVYNNGSTTANNVLIESDNLFDDILTYALNGGFLSSNSWFIPTITGYGNVTLNITKILNKTTTTMVNVTSTDLELDNTTNTDNVTVTILKVSDLLITLDVNNTNPYITENVTFTVTVYNLGEDVADNVTVYLDLPYSTSYSDVYMYDSIQGIWNVGTLENNTNRTLNITLSLNFTGTVTYNTTVNSSNMDPNTTNNYDNVTLNITSLMDLSINITINTTSTLYVSDTVSFIVEVMNHGPAVATGVNANLNLPGNIQSITQGWYAGGVWSIGTLIKNQNAKLVLTRNLTITDAKEYNINVTSPDTDKNLSNNNATFNLTITSSSDLEIRIIASNTTLNIHENMNYTIIVVNHGVNNISYANVNITLPSVFNITSNMSTNGIFNGTDWILTNLNAGDNATLIIYGNYNDGGNQTIQVFVNSTNHDKNMTNNYDNYTILVNSACNLILNFTSNTYYNWDGTITFNITIRNKGPSTAENIKIYTNLDNTQDYNLTNGYFDTLQNIWYIDSLKTDQIETLIINTTILTDYIYFANATTDTLDLNITDNVKFLNLTLTPLADLSINITVNNSNPHIGEKITFTVTVTNNGPCNTTNVIVYTTLPASSNYTISKGLYDTLNGNWSIGNLNKNEIVTLNLTINITSLGDYTYNVNVTGNVNDTNHANNNATINFTVLTTSDLEIQNIVNQTSFTVGDNITFTIIVTNHGPSTAENITIGAILPVGFIPDISTTEWNITSLNNETNITLNIIGILTNNGTQKFTTNVSSSTFDNDTTNNQNNLILNVDNLVDLELSITANSTIVYAGEFINLLINLTNHGPGNVHKILVNTNITGATSTKNTGYYDTNTGYWFVETLNTNATEILNLTLRITENTTFIANILSNNTDNNTSNNNATINITVLPLANLNITVKTSSLNLYFNEEIIYEITVTNNGYTLAENITVNTNLNNTGFTFINSNSTSYDNNTGMWNIGNLSHKQNITLILKYKTTATGYINHTFTVNTTTYETKIVDNTFNFTIFVNNSIKPTEGMVDLVINITVNNSQPNINSTITFNVTIFNNGSVEAHNITINNTLPVSFIPVGTYTGTWNITNLSGYNTYSFTFSVNVTSYGSFVDNVTVDCSEWDINPTNNRANQLIIIKESGSQYLDLSINVTREGNLTLEETLTYNITVTNNGPQDAIDVNCTIGLFDGLNVTSSTSTDYNETLNLWNVGNLSSGSSKTLTLTLNITKTGSYTNVFIVWSNEMDKNPQNNLQIDSFTINNTYIDVNIKITANRTYGNINDTILFTVTVTNPSSNPATNVNVTVDIPLEIVTFPSSDNASYYIGELNSTQTITFNFTAKINTSNTVTIIANVTINETDHNTLDNTDTIIITPFNGNNNGVADLIVNITTSLLNLTSGNMEVNQYPEYGDVPYFTVYVTNHGPDNATNVKVPLTVPAGCTIMAQDAYWDNTTESFILSNLAVNETKKLEVSMLIETTDVLLINATASCDQLDPNITDNTATISMYPFIPEPKCNLNVTVKVIGNEFHANSTVTFNITIRNDGQDIAYNVTVRNTIPTGLTFHNITTYDTYTLNSDGWDIPQILPGASMQFLVTYNITKKGLYQTTVNVNSSIQDTDPTSNGMGVAFYAGEAEPPRREVNTKLNSPTVTTTAGKVQLAGDDWTFTGTLKFANNTAAPSSYTNFAGQTLYANVTDDAGVTRTYISSTVTDSSGKATFIVPHADVGAGGTKFRIVIWYAGEKTTDDYYLPCVSSPKTNIKVVP